MYVWTCVCGHIYLLFTHTHSHTHTYGYHLCVLLEIFTSSFLCLCSHVFLFVFVCVYIINIQHTNKHTYMHAYLHIIYRFTYINTYIHTYIHTHTDGSQQAHIQASNYKYIHTYNVYLTFGYIHTYIHTYKLTQMDQSKHIFKLQTTIRCKFDDFIPLNDVSGSSPNGVPLTPFTATNFTAEDGFKYYVFSQDKSFAASSPLSLVCMFFHTCTSQTRVCIICASMDIVCEYACLHVLYRRSGSRYRNILCVLFCV